MPRMVDLKQPPFFPQLPLTQKQQEFLYRGGVRSLVSFSEELHKILAFKTEEKEMALRACISYESFNLGEDAQETVEIIKAIFLSLGSISTYPSQMLFDDGVPTLGAIYDYYVACIQACLTRRVTKRNLRIDEKEHRHLKLGSREITNIRALNVSFACAELTLQEIAFEAALSALLLSDNSAGSFQKRILANEKPCEDDETIPGYFELCEPLYEMVKDLKEASENQRHQTSNTKYIAVYSNFFVKAEVDIDSLDQLSSLIPAYEALLPIYQAKKYGLLTENNRALIRMPNQKKESLTLEHLFIQLLENEWYLAENTQKREVLQIYLDNLFVLFDSISPQELKSYQYYVNEFKKKISNVDLRMKFNFFLTKGNPKEKVVNLLEYVVKGENDKIQLMLEQEPGLLIKRGKIKDLAGRVFNNISAVEYLTWAMDTKRLQMVLSIVNQYELKSVVLEQMKGVRRRNEGVSYIFSERTIRENRFNFESLLRSYRNLIDHMRLWSRESIQEHWQRVIGSKQRNVPVYVVEEHYCRVVEQNLSIRISENKREYWWDPQSALGTDFAVFNGYKYTEPPRASYLPHLCGRQEKILEQELNALINLARCKICKTDEIVSGLECELQREAANTPYSNTSFCL